MWTSLVNIITGGDGGWTDADKQYVCGGDVAWNKVIGEPAIRSVPGLYAARGISFVWDASSSLSFDPTRRQRREWSLSESMTPAGFVDLLNTDMLGRPIQVLRVHAIEVYRESPDVRLIRVSYST